VRFEVEHEFPGSAAQVAHLMCDPEFQSRLELPDLDRAEVIENTADAAVCVLRLRYAYIGQLDSIARRIIGDRRLTWLQDLRLDTTTYTGTLTFSAESDPDRLGGEARVSITDIGGDGGTQSRRHIAGDLSVRVPLIGGTAERRIVPGLVRRLDVEAAAVAQALRDQ
jgi:uncharacterized protein DUF2505